MVPSTVERRTSQKTRLAVVVSHPIPYYAPYYRAIAADGVLDIKVFFSSRIGIDKVLDPSGMGVEIAWGTDLLSGYSHVFLPEAATIQRTNFDSVDNPSVTAHLRGFQPDIVLLHGYAQKTLVRSLLWSRRTSRPAMMISDRSFFGLSTPMRRVARRVVLPVILKQFSAFLVIGDAIESFYRSFGARPEQIFRVPNMIDQGFWIARNSMQDERARMRADLGLRDEFAVLYVGKLIQRKRPQDLLSALEVLRARAILKRPVTILFAGDGEMRQELERRIRAEHLSARVLGFVNIDQLPRYYCAADALAHPAENESFGTVAVEAAVCGLPLILSDRVGAIGRTSIARPGVNTLVHRCKDVGTLADSIQLLANEPDAAASMSLASLRLSVDHDGRMSVENTRRAIDYCLSMAPSKIRNVASIS